ncbi:MAG: arylsulfatase A-like enzyme [Candidatus Paceibacteria bacterium]|jgi:arylsulfatase A-like enzyme
MNMIGMPCVRTLLPLGLALAISLSSCGDKSIDGGGAENAAMLEFLELGIVGGAGVDDEIQVVKSLKVQESEDWTVSGCVKKVEQINLKAIKGRIPSLTLSVHEDSSQLTIPGPYDASEFNLIAVHVYWTHKWEVTVELNADNKTLARTTPQVISPGGGPQTLLFNLPQTRLIDQQIDELVVRFTNCDRPLNILSVDLLRQPDHSFLPSANSGPQLVTVGQEMRRAVGVATNLELGTTLMGGVGASLRFSYGVPGDLTMAGAESQLRVRLTGEDGEVLEQGFGLDTKPGKTRWRQGLIALDAFAGQPVNVVWSVVSPDQELESVCALGEVTRVQAGSQSRVVLLITSDTHRGDHIGSATDGVEIDTPLLDALAERGVLFDDCFSTTNITNPSHIAMMTGVHPRDTGIYNNYTRVSGSAPTLAEAFRDAGYITYAAISTKHLTNSISGLGQGFERVSAPIFSFARDGSKTIKDVDRWLSESEGMPVFIWLHLFDAHMPLRSNVPNVARYYPDKDRAFDESLPQLEAPAKKMIRGLQLEGLRDIEYPRALYKAEITELDRKLGEFLAQPFFSEAVIGFTADHGESLGNHGVYFAHEELYRDSLHVPLIISWPGGPKGVHSAGPVTNLDLGRTLLDLSGNLGTEFPGENLALQMEEPKVDPKRYSMSAHGREISLTEDGWHFQLRLGENGLADGSITRPEHQAELYYLPDDAACLEDRLDSELERAKDMRKQVLDWLAASKDMDWLGGDSGDAETLAKLEALGYTGGTGETVGKELGIDPACDCAWCEKMR